MSYVLIGLYLGTIASIAALNAGGGLLVAFGVFTLFGFLSLLGGLCLATLCVVHGDWRARKVN